MTEEFLCFLWKYRLFSPTGLTTDSGESLSVIQTGTQNTDSGPDFSDARIKIGGTLWAGNVEIHVSSSLWEKHHHHKNSAYNNVILHVVHQHDDAPKKENGQEIPTLVLKDKFEKKFFERYENFLRSKSRIPCESMLSEVGDLVKVHWTERLTIERLQRKSDAILDDLKSYRNNWSEVFYIHLARNFGIKINTEPFYQLAKSLPSSIPGKHKDSLTQIEALLFGQAGFLGQERVKRIHCGKKIMDDYFDSLIKEYAFLRKKYGLIPIDFHCWKFLRLRPASFPAIRISQLAGLLHKSSNLFSFIIESEKAGDIMRLFDVAASYYWDSHYDFGKRSSASEGPGKKHLGIKTIQAIIINTVVPFLFVYGRQKGNSSYEDRAMKFLESLPAENNAVTRQFSMLGFKNNSAFESQALVEMKNEYCSRKKCLDCLIGASLVRK